MENPAMRKVFKCFATEELRRKTKPERIKKSQTIQPVLK
jgi:hypothetical protein